MNRQPLALVLIVGLCLLAVGVGGQAQPPQPDPEMVFRRFDADRDGKLTKEEFRQLAAFSPRMKDDPAAAEQLFQRLDTNRDGVLTMAEYRQVVEIRRQMMKGGEKGLFKAKAKAPEIAEKPATAEELAFFEKKIRPVLVTHCYKCHAADSEKVRGGLLVDTRAGLRKGGDTGPAVVPGKPADSLLLKALRHTDELKMPPREKLAEAVVADFERWIKLGAADPRDGKPVASKKEIDLDKARQFWSYQPPKKSVPPAVKDGAWPKTDVDRFVRAAQEAKGLTPVADADRRTLLRRVYFDLIGLPPTPEEVAAFVNDPAADALTRVVDRLLQSPRFGERWGRHWLDVARFAESSGKEQNIAYPHAWRYRDYVIKAFNADKPYDQFIREQIAGDLLPAADEKQKAEHLVATGFLAIGPKSHNTMNPLQFRLDLADEQIDATAQAFLGQTIACARCHDHKFDPISTRDYHALAGIFSSSETRFGGVQLPGARQVTPLYELSAESGAPEGMGLRPGELTMLQRQAENLRKQRDEIVNEAKTKRDPNLVRGNPKIVFLTTRLGILEKQLGSYDENSKLKKLAMGMAERSRPADLPVFARGELDKPGELVPRGMVKVLYQGESPTIRAGSGRRELADWIAARDNPLTARVFVNRVWLHLFGQGLVTSPNNFGATGQPPSNPALLDYLAVTFMEDGWSVKKLIRSLVLSRVYQLGSNHDSRAFAVDPDNSLLWHMSQRRLDAEALRDTLLATSGQLDLEPPVGSPVSRVEGPVVQLLRSGMLSAEDRHRSVYLPVVRDQVPEILAVFDFAEPSLVVGEREDTTVPAQALFLMNNPFVLRLSENLARRLQDEERSEAGRIARAFLLAFGRIPTTTEARAASEFLRRFREVEGQSKGRTDPERAAWTAFCQSLYASAEFRYLN